jgi:predicted transposase YbfD/YdcC
MLAQARGDERLGSAGDREISNEISAEPPSLKHIDLIGALVTMNTMGTQTTTANAIRAKREVEAVLTLEANGRATAHCERFRAGITRFRINGIGLMPVAAQLNAAARTVLGRPRQTQTDSIKGSSIKFLSEVPRAGVFERRNRRRIITIGRSTIKYIKVA